MAEKEVAQIVRKWLKGKKFHYAEKSVDGMVSFRLHMSSDSDVYEGYEVTLVCGEYDVQSLFHPPVRMPEKAKAGVLEYFTWVNYRFKFGKFTVDLRDGEIRWETIRSVAELKDDVDDAMDDLIGFPIFVLDTFAPGLAAVILGMKEPGKAFEDCDKASRGETPAPEPELPEPELPEGGVERTSGRRGKTRRSGASKSARGGDAPKGGDGSGGDGAKGGQSAESSSTGNFLRSTYSLDGLNLTTPISLKDIVAAVKKFRDGAGRPDVDAPRLNILLSGAPGSGKSAFVKYLAREVGAPLRILKASDLLSRYSGDTEKRIAEEFSGARENDEIVFLDEIDSFLRDRSRADKSWEVSQVNELLQQMEEFEGVMVGATNFEDSLDRAVLRRFTYKLKFDYLTNEGKGIFFQRFFRSPLTEAERSRLDGISNLTPGDFRTVRESLYYFSDRQTNAARLSALEAESQAKGSRAKIGF